MVPYLLRFEAAYRYTLHLFRLFTLFLFPLVCDLVSKWSKGNFMDSSRVLAVHARLDAARDKLQAELDKGAARDSLVTSYEKSIEGLKDELKMHTSTVG
ncbi:TPA: hypothetical protein ACH3X1_016147 [Trebouxia sp. C0004]